MKNAYAAKLQAKRQKEINDRVMFTMQMASDAALLAANDVFGAGAERAVRFHDAMQRYFDEILTMTHEDTQDIEYTKAKLDGALRRILGDKLQPFDQRYGDLLR